MNVQDLDSPVPIVDVDIVERNLVRMQSYCDGHGLALRPHIKTHKIPDLARRQVEMGACGITCQKLGEAEVMVESGLTNVLISYPLIGPLKAARLVSLARKARMSVAVDSETGLETIVMASKEADGEIGVLIEFDSGAHRTGVVAVSEAVSLAQKASDRRGIRFEGLVTYPTTSATAEFVEEAKEAFHHAGIPIHIVSGGGTPNAWSAHTISGLTEVRVGTYVYNDLTQVEEGSATLDECAFHIYATVVSRPTADQAILDCGSKTLSSDHNGHGFGLIREYPEARIGRLYEEHALVDLAECPDKPGIGERVRVLPNHVCPVSNLHDEVVLISGETVVGRWAVAARGKTT
ncbi:D-TA family PLP-dependent enzyme [bacterium]|nr:MAG: D-TA family PLP-dependent enzyme [bacterium]